MTDSVFSMDGDTADLPALCDLADRYDAILIVDEAHATGLLGTTGAGLAEEQGVAGRVDVVVSTASKALGGLGGIITARQEVIDTIVNRGRPFIYSTGVPPSQVAAIEAALDVVRDEPWRRERVRSITLRVRRQLGELGWLSPQQSMPVFPTPVIPLVVGSAEAALALAVHLEEQGFYAPAIRPPTVAPNASRVRMTLRADMPDEHLNRLITALESGLKFRAPSIKK